MELLIIIVFVCVVLLAMTLQDNTTELTKFVVASLIIIGGTSGYYIIKSLI